MYIRIGKRIFDLFIVFFALLLLMPFLVIIPLLIKVFDPGPVIYKQLRVGQGGELFCFYKFRSMPTGTGSIPSDQVGQVKLSLIGKIIRRTNLDELPQLFNIFIGDMSVVGPRPPISSQNELITLRCENGSINCRPGLTGLAQVKSYDGMTVIQKSYFDGCYAKKITFFNDLSIIFSTVAYLFKPPPVY